MKMLSRSPESVVRPTAQFRAFTIVEIMTSMAIFSLAILGVLYAHLFGLRVFNISATRLSASQSSRATLNRVCEDIRSGKLLYVGNGNGTSFTNLPLNTPRLGNALEIFPSASSNIFIRTSWTLRRKP